ncbi:MAG: hypothetical protein RTU63_07555 [Candidatus Thorarchaeota archaeon]
MFEERDSIFEEENQEKLIEQIIAAPDCRIFGISRLDQGIIRSSRNLLIMSTAALTVLAFMLLNPDLATILSVLVLTIALIIYAILSYLNHSHKYFKIFVSELGIAKESIWDRGAIPWDKIEFIEVKYKRKNIDLIVIRVGPKILSYRNSHFATRLTIEIISDYIGGIDNWQIIEDLGEFNEITNSDRFYMKPNLAKSEGQKMLEDILLREWIGNQDFDAGKTQEHPSSKSDKELYELILNDPQCECVLDYGRFNRTISNFKVIGIMFFAAISLVFLGMPSGPFSMILMISGVFLCCFAFYPMVKGYEQFIMSPIGIARYYLGSPEAIEWQHIEFIDFHTEDEIPIPDEFFGNKQRVFCPWHIYKQLISMEMIRRYLPHLDEWKKIKRSDWREGVFRLVRPDE